MSESSRYADLRDYLRVVRTHRVLIVCVTLLFGGAALAYSLRADPVYQAESALKFQDPQAEIDVLGGSQSGGETSLERAAVGAEAVSRPEVVAAVMKQLRTRDLKTGVSARVEARSNLVVIQAESDNAERAALVANAFARQTRRVLRRDFTRNVNRKLRSLKPQIRQIKRLREPFAVAQQLALQGRLRSLKALGQPVTVARTATPAATATSPHPVRNTLLGLAAGLTVALMIAFLRDSLDRRLRSVREIADTSALPLLGRLRDDALGKATWPVGNGGRSAAPVDLDAIRILRANLDFLDVDREVSSVLVTSPLPEEGKSTVAAALAAAAALAGRSTLLIECDLRRPVFAKRLGLEAAPGLTDYLAGHAKASDILQSVELPASGSPNGTGKGDGPAGRRTLTCIVAGSPPPRPAELLGSSGFGDFIRTLSRSYDIVVIDSSPLLPVVDTLELVQYADRVVVCARARKTTRDQLQAADAALAHLPPRPAGVMVTGLRKSDDLDYGSYSYV